MSSGRPWWRSSAAILALSATALAVFAELVLGQRQGSPSDLVQFLGRFHPLAVHLPIGILVLIAVGEACTLLPRFRARLDPVFELALEALVVSALASFVLGHLLSQSGEFPPRALSLHRRLALAALAGSAFALVAWAHQSEHASARARALYRALLFGSLGVMSLGAHFGGTMTRGESYLAKYAPGPLKSLLGGAPALAASAGPSASESKPVEEPLLFEHGVLPILREHCVECHGSEKVKGGLRLDTLEYVKKGGESGAALVPGSAAQSLVVKRMRLPVDDDDHMPPKDKPAPSPEKLSLIEFWIDRGASAELRIRDALAPANARGLLERALQGASTITPTSAAVPVPDSAPRPDPITREEPPPAAATASKTEHAERAEPAKRSEPVTQSTAPALDAMSILADKCERCHGEQKRKGKLRVDSLEGILSGGTEGAAVVPGHPERSLLLRRVRLPLESDGHMPPPSYPQLGAPEIAALASWVENMSRQAKQTPTESAAAPVEVAAAPRAEEPRPEEPVTPAPEATSGAPEPVAAAAPAGPRDSGVVASLPARLDLYRDVIEPLLVEKCSSCHGSVTAIARFDATSHERLLAGGHSGAGVVPGKPEVSEVFRRVSLPKSDDEHMPPEGSPLGAGDLELLRTWIELGAKAQQPFESARLSALAREAASVRISERRRAEQPPPSRVAKAGGCAACTVGGRESGPLDAYAGATALSVAGALSLRRRRRV